MENPLSFQLPFTSTPYQVGTYPSGVAVGDFNNDGNLDIVNPNAWDGTVSVLLNNGDGTFTAAASSPYDVGAFPGGVAVGDFNNDGNLDIVTAILVNSDSGDDGYDYKLAVLLNNGNGIFQEPPQTYRVGSYPDAWPTGIAVGDFNNDGNLDIVTANIGGTISLFLNKGDGSGTFQSPQTSYVGANNLAIAVGDFNNDGNLDIVIASQDSTVTVLLNKGDSSGTFQSPQTYRVGSYPDAVAVGDFNNDGNLDIVTANYNDNTVSVLLNNGDGSGTFQAPKTLPVGLGPNAVAVGDFNKDGNLDIVTANRFDNTISVLQGNGDGTFVLYQFYPAGAFPFAVAVGDFYNDGYQDSIVTANFSANTVTVLLPPPPSLDVQVNTIQIAATLPFIGVVATISGANSANDTTATIDWGDGTAPTSGTVSANNGGTLTVSGSHTYTTSGTYPLTVSVAEGANRRQETGQAMVLPGLEVQVNTIQVTAYTPFSGNVATIIGVSRASDTRAFIEWGDGDADWGTLSANNDGTLTVSGTHTYATPSGTYPLRVTAYPGTLSNAIGYGQVIVQQGLEVQVNTIQIAATNPFNGAVATINGANSANDTTATINWGDGTPSTSGTLTANTDGTLTVSGSHTYANAGIFPFPFVLTVSAAEGTIRASGTGQAIVLPGLEVQVNTIQATAQVYFSGPLATISGANAAYDTTATIAWGDGTPPTKSSITANNDGTLTVSGTHTYAISGTLSLTVSVTEGTLNASGTGSAVVQPPPSPLGVQVNTIHATLNAPFNGAVATISGASSASDTTASIDWGDGTAPTSGTVSANDDGTLTVSGSYTYLNSGTHRLIVSVNEGTHFGVGTGQAIVQAATGVQDVQVNTLQATAQVPFSGAVATISGANRASDTTVSIDWGDGTAATPGTVLANFNGTLTVRGSHTYSRGGTFPLTVTAREGRRVATGKGRAIVKAARLHAQAFGVRGLTPPQGPFGAVSLPSTGGTRTVTVPLVRLPGNGLRARAITDRVSGSLTTTPPLASASSEIADLHGFGIVATGISATAHADLSRLRGLRGTTTFASLAIGSTTFPPHFAPRANQVVPFANGSGTVTLNEQTVTRQGNRLLIVVNALHLRITTGPQAGTDIVIGHAEAGITLA